MSKPIYLPTTGRPLDLSSLLDACPEHDNALLDFIGANAGENGAAEYAACEALRVLSGSWDDNYEGENRVYIAQTLADTIGVLQRMQTVLNNVIIAQDCLDAARDALLAQPVAQASSRVRDLLTAHDDRVATSGLTPEKHAALVRHLFPHVRTFPEHAAPAEHAEPAEPAEVTP